MEKHDTHDTLVGWGLLVSLALVFLGGLTQATESYFTIVGLSMMVFGIWGGIKLIKSNN